MMSKLLNLKSNQALIYSYLGFEVCRPEIQAYENSIRTGTAGHRNPTQRYIQSKALHQCYEKKATKIDPISLPIFNDVRECLFQNDSHLFNCKEELNELVESFKNPQGYKQMLLMSTEEQKKPKSYNTVINSAPYDIN